MLSSLYIKLQKRLKGNMFSFTYKLGHSILLSKQNSTDSEQNKLFVTKKIHIESKA